ncbi:hypothetical protein CAC42_7164 [Sphaceloma murrayae]|uniref:Homeobox domain-containing protein n=1 Tax=Sphaceloma murrayae TaxID=2082308 RepID=A0A2K1QQA5_9PEZI|nr:hypothetical protein CAC42_7164 [Sphaceloma murrayae]
MSGQDQKPVDSLWNAQQPNQSGYLSSGPRTQAPNTLAFPSFYSSRESGQQGVHNLPNIHDVYGSLGNPSPTHTGSQSQSASGNEMDFSRKNTGSSAESLSSLHHRDSVVMPSGSSQHPSGQSVGYDESEDQEDDDEDGSDDLDDTKAEHGGKQLTAAEIRQQKRKMKRFRLTHSQTRFLMSEFARQAHPDAAHRERLAREIPGLSPRQVQVWFQNRRAKLKRLSAEDRERMMRSRAIPESYGMSAPLSQPYIPSPSAAGSTTPGMQQTSTMNRPGDMRPLSLDTLRRGNEHSYTSPTSVTPALGSLAFTPPQSASDVHSPIAGSNDMGGFGYGHRAIMEQRRPLLPPSHSSAPSFSSNYGSSLGRVPSYDRVRTSGGDSIGSPLRTSMSYDNFQGATNPSQQGQDVRENQQSAGQSVSHSRGNSQRDMPPPAGPFGLGFSFESMSSYQSSVQQQHPSTPTTSGPPQSAYRGIAPPPNTQGSYFPYGDYQNSGYSTPQLPQYQQPPFGGSYTSPLSANPFGQPVMQQQTYGEQQQQQQQQQQQGSQHDRVKEEHDTHHGGGGGVPISHPY